MKPLDLGLYDRHRKDGVVTANQTATAESSQNASNDLTQISLGNITVVTPQMHLSNLSYLNVADDTSSNTNNNTAKNSDEYDDKKVISNRSNDDDENEGFGRNIEEQDTLTSINSSDELLDPHSSCKNLLSTNSLQNAPVKQSTDNEKAIGNFLHGRVLIKLFCCELNGLTANICFIMDQFVLKFFLVLSQTSHQLHQ